MNFPRFTYLISTEPVAIYIYLALSLSPRHLSEKGLGTRPVNYIHAILCAYLTFYSFYFCGTSGYEPISTQGDDMDESEPLLPDPATHPAFEIPLTVSITHQMGLQRLGSMQAQGDSQFIKPTDPSGMLQLQSWCMFYGF